MAKSVLLARPHPFIVSEMKPFLEENGYAVKKIESLVELKPNVAGVSGAIISLAIVSSMGETAEAVFAEIRKVSPRLPVLFAAMISFEEMKSAIERIAKNSSIEATILGVDAANENHPELGKPNTLLYFSKDDLTNPERRALVSKIIQRHFR